MQTRSRSSANKTASSHTLHTLAQSLAMAGVVIGRVLNGQSLTRAMSDLRASGPLRAAVQALAYSTLRDHGRCDALLAALTRRPPTASLSGLLLAALTELRKDHQGAHAVVHQAVEAAAQVAPRNPEVAKGLVNGVLRAYLRQQETLNTRLEGSETAQWLHPAWWIARVKADWPSHWQGVLLAGNEIPGMTLRVNARRARVDDVLDRLLAAGLDARPLGGQAIRLSRPAAVEKLPGFFAGEFSVQDWGAQQAALLLDVKPGMRVLDACAAPGGKAAHIAEITDCELVAMDVDAERLQRVSENLERLDLLALVQQGDALAPAATLGGSARFDRILADVPCSASGVVRRHPDVKWLRRDSDIARFATTQQAMLEALWPLLNPGGHLLYATCSVFRQENERQIDGFLSRHEDARNLEPGDAPAHLVWASPGQILPGPLSDGFYYALLEKVA